MRYLLSTMASSNKYRRVCLGNFQSQVAIKDDGRRRAEVCRWLCHFLEEHQVCLHNLSLIVII